MKMLQMGEQGEYWWLVSPSTIWPLTDLVLRFHRGLRLCVTSFDSGPLQLVEEELAQGWTTQGAVAISPAVVEQLSIPHDQYDEWYLLNAWTSDEDVEVFVNYGTFTLVSPEEIYKSFHPTWEKTGLDQLAAIQERFWSQLHRVKPETYVAMGENDVVVSRNRRFIQSVRDAVERGAES